jgi:hypothetical protein
MTGKTSAKRQRVPQTAAEAALLKQALGMRKNVVPIVGAAAQVVAKHGATGTSTAGKTQLQIRRTGRGGPTETSGRAKALKGCKGTRGAAFYSCVVSALGKAPANLAKKYGGARA